MGEIMINCCAQMLKLWKQSGKDNRKEDMWKLDKYNIKVNIAHSKLAMKNDTQN